MPPVMTNRLQANIQPKFRGARPRLALLRITAVYTAPLRSMDCRKFRGWASLCYFPVQKPTVRPAGCALIRDYSF